MVPVLHRDIGVEKPNEGLNTVGFVGCDLHQPYCLIAFLSGPHRFCIAPEAKEGVQTPSRNGNSMPRVLLSLILAGSSDSMAISDGSGAGNGFVGLAVESDKSRLQRLAGPPDPAHRLDAPLEIHYTLGVGQNHA